MASGHMNRTKRPNTWLYRPARRREENPCQLGAVHTWHKAALDDFRSNVCFRGRTGQHIPGQATFIEAGATALKLINIKIEISSRAILSDL
jgi:hypothetical protein